MTTSNMIELSHPCIKQLITQDAQLAKLIKHIGPITFPKRPSPLKSIIRSIIGQQITVKLAQTIFQRLTETVNDDWSIASLSKLSATKLQELGLSRAKTQCIIALLEHVQAGNIDFQKLPYLSNTAFTRNLAQVKGIGQWTAEIYLIFTLHRIDILPVKDVGLQRAAQWLYQPTNTTKAETLKQCNQRWTGCQTIGALYLWEAIRRGYLEYDHIDVL
ncbi:DNA-3-methyladenine glycosylase [Staphylococcus arlettae]|uniref:DNA-3-methyladenine glycosylase family protein n=1 Tax=Staphylococcus arlettae TaxID=29378 RepID=UPI0034DD240C